MKLLKTAITVKTNMRIVIRDRIVIGCQDKEVSQSLGLKGNELTLDDAITTVGLVSNVCVDSIDYTVLTGIAVVAAARYFGRARESFRDDLNNKCVCLTRCFKCLETQHLATRSGS